MENINTAPTNPDDIKKGENKVRLLLEEHIDELSRQEQTEETIAEIKKYQAKLADHLNMLDKKYAVEETEDIDPWGGDRDAQKGDQIRAQQKLRKDIVGGLQ